MLEPTDNVVFKGTSLRPRSLLRCLACLLSVRVMSCRKCGYRFLWELKVGKDLNRCPVCKRRRGWDDVPLLLAAASHCILPSQCAACTAGLILGPPTFITPIESSAVHIRSFRRREK